MTDLLKQNGKKIAVLSAALFFFILLSACTAFSNREVTVGNASEKESKEYFFRQLYNPDGMTADTENFLQGNLLADDFSDNPAEVLHKLNEYYTISHDPDYLQIAADLCRYAAVNNSDAEKAVSCCLSALYYCGEALYEREKLKMDDAKNFSTYQLILIYNDAVTGIFRYLKQKDLLNHKSFVLEDLEGRRYTFKEKKYKLSVPVESIEDFSLCADCKVGGLQQRTRRSGLGVPLIAHVKNSQMYKSLKTPDNLTIPVTFVIQMEGQDPRNLNICLGFQDTTLEETLALDIVPKGSAFSDCILTFDFSTPLAFFLNSQPERNLLLVMLNPREEEKNTGLYMLEPYNPEKIPVVFVHGLMSSPDTWMQMINSLKNDPMIRKHYQFWFFSYSSGVPVISTAADLSRALYAAQKELCTTPEAAKKFNQMVLVGHSMGGLVSRTLLQKDEYYLLEQLIGQSWEKLIAGLPEKDIDEIKKIAVFPALPFVHRVVFLAVPHKGSEMAKWSIARLGANLIQLPDSMIRQASYYKDLLIRSGKASDSILKLQAEIVTGIDNLDPDNPFILALSKSKMKDDLVFHSIIGNREGDNRPGGSDGVVPYFSSHLDHAESELIVKSGHSVHRTPGAIRELLRILLLHLKQNGVTQQQ